MVGRVYTLPHPHMHPSILPSPVQSVWVGVSAVRGIYVSRFPHSLSRHIWRYITKHGKLYLQRLTQLNKCIVLIFFSFWFSDVYKYTEIRKLCLSKHKFIVWVEVKLSRCKQFFVSWGVAFSHFNILYYMNDIIYGIADFRNWRAKSYSTILQEKSLCTRKFHKSDWFAAGEKDWLVILSLRV